MMFGIEMSIILDKELRKLNGERDVKITLPDFCVFTDEELAKIEELELTKVSSLEGLDRLPNLKRLSIKSPDFSNVSIDLEIQDSYINTITDFNILKALHNLEELEIINDINITTLDLEGLDNLRKITVINNPNLVEIKHLEEKKKLEDIMIYGNALSMPFDIETYIDNTRGARRNILDVSMYISLVNQNIELSNALSIASLIGDTDLKFAERIGFLDFAILRPEHLEPMYLNMMKLFIKNNLYDKSEEEKVKYVYRYVKNRLTFDEEGLKEREKEYNEHLNSTGALPEFRKRKFASFHNSSVAYHTKKANCDGYVNLMRFMLTMLNVQSFNVHCRDRRSRVLAQNHSILRVNCDGSWHYCNPKYTEDNPKEVFMGTMEDLEQYFEFNIYEKLVSKGESYGNNNAKDINQAVRK